MIALFKALPFGIFLTLLLALFMGSGGAQSSLLAIRHFQVADVVDLGFDFRVYWSWTLFVAGTVLTWAILLMMD